MPSPCSSTQPWPSRSSYLKRRAHRLSWMLSPGSSRPSSRSVHNVQPLLPHYIGWRAAPTSREAQFLPLTFRIAQDQIIEAVGTDELIPALNSIISHLNLQQLTQYAVVLCKHLTDAFSRVASRALEDDNSAMLAVGCLSGTAISPTLSGGHANGLCCLVCSNVHDVAKCRRPGVPAGARSTHMRVSAALSGVLDSLFNVKPKEPDDSVEFQQQVAAVTALLVPWLHTLFTGPGDNIVRCAHRTHTDTHLSSHS